MRAQKGKVAIVVLALLAGGAANALADEAATVGSAGEAAAVAYPGNSGWRFTVNQEIEITHLGVLDLDSPGLTPGTKVGLWKNPRAGGFEFIRSVEIGGTVGELVGNHRYVAITPITLTPDTAPPTVINGVSYVDRYVLGVFSPSGAQDRISIPSGTGLTHSSAIDLGGSWPQGFPTAFTAEIYKYPASDSFVPPWGGVSTGHFGVNFMYTLAGTPTNQAPEAVADSAVTQINSLLSIDVLSNDSDPENEALSIESYTQGTNGRVSRNPLDADELIYCPNSDFVGSDSFTYTITDGNGGTATATVTVTIEAGTLTIDIKPGSYPNAINLGGKGVIPVAIFSSESFDATKLNPETIFLDGLTVAVRGKGNPYLSHAEDVNADGIADLVVQFDTENLAPDTFQNGVAKVTVESEGQRLYLGEDTVTIVPPQ
jgi:hypothetical protein